MNTIDKTNERIFQTYGRLPIALEKGGAATCKDENGKTYIDFGSGIGTNSLGYCDETWVEAVCAQVHSLQHASNYYYTEPQAAVAETLHQLTATERVFFCNSGAEANECAMKIARKYSSDKYGENRGTIITLQNSFHGRTMETLAATGQAVFHQYFYPFPTGFRYAKANDFDDLLANVDDTVCAVMMELIQGEGGVCALEKDYVQKVADLCKEKDLLLIVDEVQTGVGRTGTFLACEQYDLKPNILTLAKGLGGGLPIGACLADATCADTLTKGTHGSTFGGNPVSCAGAKAVLQKITATDFLPTVKEKAEYLRTKLQEMDEVASLSGLGMMIGITLKTKNAGEVLQQAAERGLLLLTAKEKVRLLPPLTISYEEMDAGLAILRAILQA